MSGGSRVRKDFEINEDKGNISPILLSQENISLPRNLIKAKNTYSIFVAHRSRKIIILDSPQNRCFNFAVDARLFILADLLIFFLFFIFFIFLFYIFLFFPDGHDLLILTTVSFFNSYFEIYNLSYYNLSIIKSKASFVLLYSLLNAFNVIFGISMKFFPFFGSFKQNMSLKNKSIK